MTAYPTSENIYLIGNGVIAKALAVTLTLNGKNVILLRGSVDNQPDYTETIEVETGEQTLKAEVVISTLSSHSDMDGIILLTNKSFGNEKLAEKLKNKARHCPVVFLQNGLNIENSFIERGFKELYRCVLFVTSQSVSETNVRFRRAATSPVGIVTGSSEGLQHIISQISTDVFPFIAEENIQEVLWKKVIINCVANSICPLLEIDNGIFHRNESARAIARTVIRECVAVAAQQGVHLEEDDVLDYMVNISKISDGQKISTYQDILNGHETEIETLNLAISKIAKASGNLEVPITTLLGEMIKIKADLFRK
ncbi:ketopantoate reductase [Pedobacter westerhofensis]|uniref:2-dehydropantoate 2-reductase n=1 Tax=Pedobacter westerhofensis TaxID=425512 RepID=A0A521BQD6_9SPHI|nr:2-dehydropantoate 2-reductase [Pedobacter westerhofensis]SMO48961.1 ketopantoate reductase [Pedobacter westerhofensis]